MNSNKHCWVPKIAGWKLVVLLVAFVAIDGPHRMASGQDDLGMEGYEMDDGTLGSSYQRGGYGRNRYGTSGSGDGSQFLMAPVVSLVKSIDMGSLLDPNVKFDVRLGPALEAEAKEIFSSGHPALARELFYGHMVAEYDDAGSKVMSARLSPLLKRPAWQLRFGVSMAIRGGEDVTDPSPITAGNGYGRGGYTSTMDSDMDFDMMPAGGSQTRGSDRRRSDRGRRPDLDSNPDADLDAIDALTTRGSISGDPRLGPGSQLLADGRPAAENNTQTVAPPMLNADVAERLEEYLGAVATHCAAEFDKRFSAGDFGTLFNEPETTEVPAEAPAGRTFQAGLVESQPKYLNASAAQLLREAPGQSSMWTPGLEFLGEGPSSEMVELAKAKQIDYLIHFDVVLKQTGRLNQTFVQNVSRARLIDVMQNKSLIVSKAIDSSEVRQLQSAGRMPDPSAYIADQMSNLWRAVDRDTKLVPMPKLSPDSARRRIGQLIKSGGSRNLRTLSEIRLYQSLGLIDQAEVANAFDIVGGSDALVILYGPRQERLDMARTWATESVSEKVDE